MKRRSALPLTAAGATVLLALAACSGSKPSSWETSGGYNAALNAVANASSHKGGTIIFDYSTVPDSTDPGNTYHAEVWNLLRLYGRALVTYKSAPGAAGMQLVPDLATSLGEETPSRPGYLRRRLLTLNPKAAAGGTQALTARQQSWFGLAATGITGITGIGMVTGVRSGLRNPPRLTVLAIVGEARPPCSVPCGWSGPCSGAGRGSPSAQPWS